MATTPDPGGKTTSGPDHELGRSLVEEVEGMCDEDRGVTWTRDTSKRLTMTYTDDLISLCWKLLDDIIDKHPGIWEDGWSCPELAAIATHIQYDMQWMKKETDNGVSTH